MDTRNLNIVTFEEYLGYMDVLINGTDDEKAEQSFSMLASGKDHLDYEDFSKMVSSVLTMYNSITGSHFEAQDESIRSLFAKLDKSRDGVIDVFEFKESMKSDYKHIFDWFDFMNKGVAEQVSQGELERISEKESYI